MPELPWKRCIPNFKDRSTGFKRSHAIAGWFWQTPGWQANSLQNNFLKIASFEEKRNHYFSAKYNSENNYLMQGRWRECKSLICTHIITWRITHHLPGTQQPSVFDLQRAATPRCTWARCFLPVGTIYLQSECWLHTLEEFGLRRPWWAIGLPETVKSNSKQSYLLGNLARLLASEVYS